MKQIITIPGVEDMSVADKTFIYIAGSLIRADMESAPTSVVFIVFRRRRQKASTHYYSRR